MELEATSTTRRSSVKKQTIPDCRGKNTYRSYAKCMYQNRKSTLAHNKWWFES